MQLQEQELADKPHDPRFRGQESAASSQSFPGVLIVTDRDLVCRSPIGP